MISELLTFFGRHFTLALQITFVANKYERDVFTCVSFDLCHPTLDSGKRFTICDVVNNIYSVCSLVVARSNSLEAFRANEVPDLKFDYLLININGPDFEVYTDRGHEVVIKGVILNNKIMLFTPCRNSHAKIQMDKSLTANLAKREDFPTPGFPI